MGSARPRGALAAKPSSGIAPPAVLGTWIVNRVSHDGLLFGPNPASGNSGPTWRRAVGDRVQAACRNGDDWFRCAVNLCPRARTAPGHFGIERAVLVDVADTGLAFHVDVRIRRAFIGNTRTDFQYHRLHLAAVL